MQKSVLLFADEPVVFGESLISSRTAKDLPAFGKAMVDSLNKHAAN